MYLSVNGNRMLAIVSIAVVLAVAGVANAATDAALRDPISVIESDFRAGKIDIDRKAILQVTAIKNPRALPAEYQLVDPIAGRVLLRSATPALVKIIQQWEQLSPSTQQTITSVLARPAGDYTFDSPGGFFKMHYSLVGPDSVPPADGNGNGVPDYVERCAAYCDSSMAKHTMLGYLMPPSDGGLGGDNKYDVYFEEMIYYGYAQPEAPGPEPWSDYTSYLVLHRDFIGFPPNTDPEGNQAGAAKATAAHELHHAVQFAYNVNAELWFMELDATYMEDIVFDQVNDNYNYLSMFFGSPATGLMDNTSHVYSCFIWGLYLAQRFDTALMVDVWEGARYKTAYAALSDSLQGNFGWTQDSAFAEFATWNFCTNYRNDGLHHAEASSYPLVALDRTHTTYPVATTTSLTSPQGYGSAYVQFIPNATPGKLRLIFDGNDSRQWAAYIIKTTGLNSHEVMKLDLTAPNYCDTIDVLGFSGLSSATLVAVNLSEGSSGLPFTYSAQILPGYDLKSQMTTDSLVYSGASRNYVVKVKNLSTLTDGVKVVWFDSNGWMKKDSLSRSLSPGDSTFFDAPIKPPVGTALSSQSAVTITARSINDSLEFSNFQFSSTVVLQRGDLTFDGKIDLSDLSYMVAYLTAGGLPPKPVMEAGNFSCSGIVDLADLSALVSYLTGNSGPCACNPF
ncbi:hypothetical protein C3F09_00380 [candidate division GN15 bacterium]|uniref:Dockerin domain-containing protein n=1 Tax=candidate division GN15 bacterium TaxID=2072418 RepID=A0A855X4X1_9BACT|nr:MAG: hypothetical protein C3F09_00380 [candidate division GN15 bacterium]